MSADDAASFFTRLAVDAPNAWLDPEPALPVPPYRRDISASALKLFADCERKWFFRYLCNVVEDPGSSASFYGTAFHDALEAFHTTYPRPGDVDQAQLTRRLASDITNAFAKYAAKFSGALEVELLSRRAQRSGVRYLEWLRRRAQEAPFEVIGNETRTTLELRGSSFVGFIDRLDRDLASGNVAVIDYKTGSIAQSAAEYREDVAAFREFQLPFYYWARTAAGDRVTKLALIPLKDPLLDVVPIELEIVNGYAATSGRATRGKISIAELEIARNRMAELAHVLSKATKGDFATTRDPENCAYCSYVSACRQRPAICDDRFGR